MYVIEPIPGRHVIQKNFVTLPERASSYNGRKLTLNERFSIFERGYMISKVTDEEESEQKTIRLIPSEGFKPKTQEEIIEMINKLTEKTEKSARRKNTEILMCGSSQECSPTKTPSPPLTETDSP